MLCADEDYVDYNNMLRTGIIDAYSGITQGLGPMKAPQCLRQELPAILEFLSSIGAEIDTMEPDEDVIRAAINMLGDLCSCMQVRMRRCFVWLCVYTCVNVASVFEWCSIACNFTIRKNACGIRGAADVYHVMISS